MSEPNQQREVDGVPGVTDAFLPSSTSAPAEESEAPQEGGQEQQQQQQFLPPLPKNTRQQDEEEDDDEEEELVTRLVIKDIIVDNFKSYAGVHKIGPFHSTFTAIVGPNGSGKSNVIDSMLFVFGKAAKKLRLDKLSELIHNSKAYPNLTHASVTVNFHEQKQVSPKKVREMEAACQRDGSFFDPARKWVVIPGTELSVKREVFRTGSSQYSIDGKKCTQKDVIAHLTGLGVDLDHNRFLILQGEVEQIAMMKPKAEKEGEEGLLEYFDDLIGTNKFVTEINDLTLKVEQLQDQRLHLLDTKQKVGKELGALSEAKDQCLDFVSKDNHLQHILSIMCQQELKKIKTALAEPLAKIEEQKKRLAEIKEALDASDALQKDLILERNDRQHNCKAQNLLHQKALQEVSNIETKIAELEAGNSSLDKEKAEKKKKLDKHMKALRDAEAEHNDAKNTSVLSLQHTQEAAKLVEQLQPQFDAMRDEVEKQLTPLRKEQQKIDTKLIPFQSKLTEATTRVRDAKSFQEELVEEHNRRLEDHGKAIRTREEATREMDQKIKILDAVADAKDKEEKIQVDLEQKEAVWYEKHKRFSQIDQRIAFIVESAKQDSADDRVTNFLLKQNGLTGYYGTLRQLGSIPDQYDIAAGTAGGATWGHHVVKDAATATKCTDLLRQNKVGRASFLVLEKLEKSMGKQMDSKFAVPAGASRLYDLIKPLEGKFSIAFFFAVRNTLVVKDLSMARKFAFGQQDGKRHRVASLRGDLVEPNGTLSGGGAPKPAKLKAAQAPQDRAKIKKDLEALQGELQKAKEEEDAVASEKRVLEASLHRCREQVANLNPVAIRQMKTEVATLQKQLEMASKTEEELRVKIEKFENDPKQIRRQKEAEAAVEAALKDQQEVQRSMQSLIDQKDDLKLQMENAGGEEYVHLKMKLADEKKRRDENEEKASAASTKLSRLSVTIEKAKKTVQELEEALKDIEERQAVERQKELDEAKEQLRERSEKEKELLAELEKMKESVNEIDAKVKVEENRRKELRTEEHDCEDKQKEVEESISKFQERMGVIEAKMMSCEDKIRENVDKFGIETLDRQDAGLDTSDHGNQTFGEDDEEEEDQINEPPSSSTAAMDPNHAWRRDGKSGKFVRENEIIMENYTTKKTDEQLETYNREQLTALAKELHTEIEDLKGKIDMESVAQWRVKNEEYKKADEEYMQVKEEVHDTEEQLESTKNSRKVIFLKKFRLINRKLKEMYQMITDGGDAEVELVDAQDPFEGINFVVRPPKKSWKVVGNLSGGEKTLSSLALVFALHHVKPTPIYVMDEIDAALDFKNVSIVARYILEQAVDAQFVIISLRNNMFELAHRLVGISKVNDCTQSAALDPRAAAAKIQKTAISAQQASPGALRQRNSANMLNVKGLKAGATTSMSQIQQQQQPSRPLAQRDSAPANPGPQKRNREDDDALEGASSPSGGQ